MRTIIEGNPQYISQVISFLAWIENCKHRNQISEFKVRIDNTDSKMNLRFAFDNLDIQKQYEEYLRMYAQYNTVQINPIFYVGNKFKVNV